MLMRWREEWGFPLDHAGRLEGAVLHGVQSTVGRGHVYASTAQIIGSLQETAPHLAENPQAISEALKALHEAKTVVIDKATAPGTAAIYTPWQHQMEEKCAALLKTRAKSAHNPEPLIEGLSHVGDSAAAAKESGADLKGVGKAALEDWSKGCKTTLTEDQQLAALCALTEPVAVLTGLPGTGKTTTLRAVVSLLQDARVPFLLAAPTGIAAKRLSSVANAPASTIHRAFKAKNIKTDDSREATYLGVVGDSTKKSDSTNEEEKWVYGPDNPHPAAVVVIDESSMLDLHMLYRVLSGTSLTCRLVFVGDPFQLPQSEPGMCCGNWFNRNHFPTPIWTRSFARRTPAGSLSRPMLFIGGNPPRVMGRILYWFLRLGIPKPPI